MLPNDRLGLKSVIQRMSARCPVCPKADATERFMSTRPSLTPLADLGRSPRQAPLHGVRPAGIGAADDDAEVGARLRSRRARASLFDARDAA
jgi:hypothetical protein